MRILIADDHALFRSGCRMMLEDMYPGVGVVEAKDLGSALDCLADNPDFDLITLDLVMPGMESISSISRVRKLVPDVPLVMLSGFERPSDVREALRLGAAGYIPKSAPKQVIIRALELISSGGTYFPADLLSGASEGMFPHGCPSLMSESATSVDANLTRRQRDVLGLMAQGKSNRQIAEELGLAEGTVKVHVAAVLKALKVSNRTQAVLAVTRARV